MDMEITANFVFPFFRFRGNMEKVGKRVTKVCFLVSSLCNEGPVNVMYNIIRYMDFSRFEVSIITLIPEKKTSRIDDFRRFPLTIHQLAPKDPLSPLALFKALKREVKAVDPDMLHAHCPRSLYLMCFLPRKYKRVYTIHIYPGLQQQILYGKWKGTIVNQLNHFFTRRVDLPIGCAESVGTLYKERKGWDIPCIPNGSSLPVWEPDESHREELRERLGLKEGIRYFIFIGRFSKEKNPELLVQAFKRMEGKPVGLVMLGDGPLWEKLKREENDRLLLPGFRTNVYDYLIAADYYISASDVEGLANTLLESMTVGLPMLLSDIPSHREVFAKTRRTVGYIFTNTDLEDLMDKLEKVLRLDRKEVEREVQETFKRYYTAEKMSQAYQKAYESL